MHTETMPPSIPHEAVVEVLHNEPQLVAMLLGKLGTHLPSGAAPFFLDSNLSLCDPGWKKTLIVDNVVVFDGIDGKVAVIAEVQTNPPNRSRLLAWPAYVCVARSIYKCDVILLVIGLGKKAVRGSEKAIPTGHPGFDLTPLVTGHGRLPGAGGPVFAPELTVLNVLTGDLDMTTHEARMLALVNLASASPERRVTYTRIIQAAIPEPAKKALEDLMKTKIKDPFIDAFVAEGLAKGEAQMLLKYLDSRFEVPAHIRERVLASTNTGELEAWFDRALTAATLDEAFAE